MKYSADCLVLAQAFPSEFDPKKCCDDGRVVCSQDKLKIWEIHLDYNNLQGPFPTQLCNLTEIKRLRMPNTHLNGQIPVELGNLISLTELSLSGNLLSGAIPSSIGFLTSLTQLELNDNILTGTVPPSISQLTKLEILALDSNQLEGPMPDLKQMQSLTSLALAGNTFQGDISISLPLNLDSLSFCSVPATVCSSKPSICSTSNNLTDCVILNNNPNNSSETSQPPRTNLDNASSDNGLNLSAISITIISISAVFFILICAAVLYVRLNHSNHGPEPNAKNKRPPSTESERKPRKVQYVMRPSDIEAPVDGTSQGFEFMQYLHENSTKGQDIQNAMDSSLKIKPPSSSLALSRISGTGEFMDTKWLQDLDNYHSSPGYSHEHLDDVDQYYSKEYFINRDDTVRHSNGIALHYCPPETRQAWKDIHKVNSIGSDGVRRFSWQSNSTAYFSK